MRSEIGTCQEHHAESFSRVQSWAQSHIALTAAEKNDELSCRLFFGSVALFNNLRAANPMEANLCSFNNELSRDFPGGESSELLERIRLRLSEYCARFYGLDVQVDDISLLHAFVCANFPGASQACLPPHDHRRSSVVVTYYANIKENEGLVRLWNPLAEEGESVILSPRTGDLVFVPGNIPHDILPFEPSDPFVSVETHFAIRGFPELPLPCRRFAEPS